MKLITSMKIDRDADDIYYDAQKKQIYISCGGGYLEVIRQGNLIPINFRPG